MKNRKILTIVLFSAFIFCSIFLVGCSETNSKNTFNSLMLNMTKISNTLDNVKNIETNELIISDFMDENELARIDSQNYIDKVATNGAMNSYITKISALNNNVITTIEVNDLINNKKRQIYAKSSYVKALCSQNLSAKVELKNSQLKTLGELNNIIMANNTRISLTRNEITNNLKNVSAIKNEYSSKPEQLNSRYTKLKTSLNTRLSYYNNLLSGLEEVSTILCKEVEYPYISDDYIIEDELVEQNKDNSVKTGLQKNIDTYENAGTNIYGDIRNNPAYNPDNYLKNFNPGYGMYGGGMNGFGYGGYGFNGYGINGFGGMYGYGMPYGGGYIYPNINTFGTYKNIDTYRSHKDWNKQQEEINQSEQVNETEDTNLNVTNDLFTKKPRPKPMPYKYDQERNTAPLENDDNEDHFVDKQEQPKIEKIIDGQQIYKKQGI